MTHLRAVVLLSGVVALTACASVTSREEAGGAARASLGDMPAAWAAAQASVGDVQVGWADKFQDKLLTKLVREAQVNNKDLQAAAANVEQSWALARQAGAALKPDVTLTTGGGRSGTLDRQTPDSSNVRAGMQVNWELDVWGRIRAGQQAAAATAESLEADFRFSQQSLAASVARAYFLAIEAGLLADVTRKSLDALTEMTRIVTVQYKHGMASSQDLALSKSDLATARATLAEAEGAQRAALRALELLLGRYPGADLTVRTSLPGTPPAPPPGVPSEILERRPDIVAAERRVAAAFNRLDEAKAARLPRIALTSSIGGSSNELGDVVDPKNVAWNVAGNLVAPVYRGGALQAQVEISTFEQKQAVAAYGQAALNAFKEVETSLDQNVVLRERSEALNEASKEAHKAFRIAQLRYNEGEIEVLEVLIIQQRVFTAESNHVSNERAWLERWVNLNLALGGSWE